MKTLTHKLMTTAAAITLLATPALAEMTSQTEAEVTSDGVVIEQSTEAETSIGTEIENGVNTAEETGAELWQETKDGASEMADATSEAASDAWDATKSGAKKLADALATFGNETVTEITGTKVLSQDGNDIGEIDAIVTAEGGTMAVVGMGGFLGIGEHDVLVPVDEFSVVDDTTVMIEGATEAELEAMPDVDVSAYTEVEGDMTLEQAMQS
ncbi:PRC-barrel domain-containing protein [Celeribacter sp. SCSIO 80788]|uniref:PRC-barrel domain-containing protein n=1 Tax=Celeribacter sp. SCSIO 80788 TaxID=3117013 RepID=UPI003DA456AF